jgi:methionine aminotransferase
MEYHSDHYLNLPNFYQSKRDLFLDQLTNSKFTLRPSTGTYFQLADYSEISDISDVEFANYLTQEIGVAAIPISVFYDVAPKDKYVRFCFAKNDATIIQACKKLKVI